jgi:hypothetical protein
MRSRLCWMLLIFVWLFRIQSQNLHQKLLLRLPILLNHHLHIPPRIQRKILLPHLLQRSQLTQPRHILIPFEITSEGRGVVITMTANDHTLKFNLFRLHASCLLPPPTPQRSHPGASTTNRVWHAVAPDHHRKCKHQSCYRHKLAAHTALSPKGY